MNFVRILPYYIRWHYSRALSDMMSLWKNFLVLMVHFFSIRLLFSTLFSPWQRMEEGYTHTADASAFFGTMVVNTLMRLVGALMRSITIFIGLIALLCVIVLGIVGFLLWLLLPLALFQIFIAGLYYILS